MPDFDALVVKAALLLETEAEPREDGSYVLEIETGEGRTQVVHVYTETVEEGFNAGDTIVIARTKVGNYKAAINPNYLLQCNGEMIFGRIYLGEEEEATPIIVDGGTLLEFATPRLIASIIEEVACRGDSLEEELFHKDEE